jgi:hypothetical protein
MFKIAQALLMCSLSLYAQQSHPGARTVMDAHNCYPYFDWWGDRIDRALRQALRWPLNRISLGIPIPKPAAVGRWSPTVIRLTAMSRPWDQYFFERVRPIEV